MIDYFICSPSLCQSTDSKSVILADDINTSDHYAVSLNISDINTSVVSLHANQPRYKPRWDRAVMYQSTCSRHLSCIAVPVEAQKQPIVAIIFKF